MHDRDATSELIWRFGPHEWRPRRLPRLMGIVNVTPDSFSDGGDFLDPQQAVEHAMQLVSDGASILDVGGESTRPGSEIVDVMEELRRVVPVIEQLSTMTDVPLSIDTTKSTVAREALAAGAVIVNDISGLTFDSAMAAVCAEHKAGVVCMHIQGTPQTMQNEPRYENVVSEVRQFLDARLAELERQGVARERVAIDPGIGFGKTAGHNVELLSNVAALRELGRPVLIGHSRKRFLKHVLGREVEERLAGTVGVAIGVASQSADMIRVHDVRAVHDALLAWDTISRSDADG